MNTGWLVESYAEGVAKIGENMLMVDIESHEVQCMHCLSF